MCIRDSYVDLIANPEVKETFVKRSQILKEIRAYLDEKGFLDVYKRQAAIVHGGTEHRVAVSLHGQRKNFIFGYLSHNSHTPLTPRHPGLDGF